MYAEQQPAEQQASGNPLFWTDERSEWDAEEQVISLGTELPSDPCEAPSFIYMWTNRDTDSDEQAEKDKKSSLAAPAATPSAPADTATSVPIQEMTVSGTLQVRGTLM
eukprot:6066349-Amphidinium_carterae.1